MAAEGVRIPDQAYSRQSDLTNSMLVDGKPARDWLHGFNVFADGVLVNHNRVHPDYMLAQQTCFASMAAVSLARQYIPQSMVFNAGLAYRALTEVRFTPGTDTKYGTGKAIAAPGEQSTTARPTAAIAATSTIPKARIGPRR